MIHFMDGNIFEADTQGIVNPVNCVGVMGAGLAKRFKEFYPDMFQQYKTACDTKQLVPGPIFVWVLDAYDITPREMLYIFNFPTKFHWRDSSKMEYIRKGIAALIIAMGEHEVNSIAIPAIGCGLGGLKWEEVSGEIINQFRQKAPDKIVWLYPPH